jgi:putative endonuclease
VDDRIDLGRIGEEAALQWYRAAGYRPVARNWRCSLGELDLVLRRGATVVVCEVKTRRGGAFGSPFEAVHWAKQRKLRALAEVFLSRVSYGEVRFDVASVTVPRSGGPEVHVFEDAF